MWWSLMQSDLSVVGLRGGALHRTVKQQLFCYFDTSLGKSRDSSSKRSNKVECQHLELGCTPWGGKPPLGFVVHRSMTYIGRTVCLPTVDRRFVWRSLLELESWVDLYTCVNEHAYVQGPSSGRVENVLRSYSRVARRTVLKTVLSQLINTIVNRVLVDPVVTAANNTTTFIS